MVKKIENYLFDLFGLVLPGIIFIALLVSEPIYLYYEYSDVKSTEVKAALDTLKGFTNDYTNLFIIFAIIVVFYVLGNIIKVFSKVMYDVLKVGFDSIIVQLVLGIYEMMLYVVLAIVKFIVNIFSKKKFDIDNAKVKAFFFDRGVRNKYRKKKLATLNRLVLYLISSGIAIYDLIALYLEKIFIFKPLDNYDFTGRNREAVLVMFNKIYGQEAEFNWYDTYKISNLLLFQDGVDTLNNKFMSKYNMYRSLSFIFGLNFLYLLYLQLQFYSDANVFTLFYLLNFIAWFAFHEKFKRYWTLAGNESLMNVYTYFLNKQLMQTNLEEDVDE